MCGVLALVGCATDYSSTPTPILCSQAFKVDPGFNGLIFDAQEQEMMKELRSRGEDCERFAATHVVEIR
ncbi:hypothetical protein [Cereibacter johrii]|uniref:hypothetical protein n=1 Tax=Cereibacter johrii TaxID=445629 RepID=UPI000DCE5D52|nr:hypothetical protein [Cereibacter johrii]RAZ83543.1 hypothetical protein DDV93_14685 [Cereibacter johrii]